MTTEKVPPEYLHPSENPCPICGSSDFSWGLPIAGRNAPGEYIYLRPKGKTWEDGDIVLEVRLCERCNNVQFFKVDS